MSDLDRALSATVDFLRRYVVFPLDEQANAAALWAGHTWVYDQFDTTPYLAIQSAEKRSGKSRLLEALRLVTRQPVPMAGASLAALFRIIDERHPTLLLDEADTIFNKRSSDSTEDVRGLLNNGYRRGVPFFRVVGEGKKMRVESFDVFCPKAIASIRALPDTVQDRSVVISLKRRARSEPIERFRFRRAELEAMPLREWWEAIAGELVLPEEVDVPDELDDRAADGWEPLLALADAAGGEWPARGRHAALVLSGAVEVDDEKAAIILLADVRSIFAERGERVTIKQLVEDLRSDAYEMSPWQEWSGGRGIQARGVGRLLSAFGIRAKQMKVEGINVRGYDRDQFADAFTRYLPPSLGSVSNRYSATGKRESEHEGSAVAVQDAPPGEETESADDGDALLIRPRGAPSAGNGHVGLWDQPAAGHACVKCGELTPTDELTHVGGIGEDARFEHRRQCLGSVPADALDRVDPHGFLAVPEYAAQQRAAGKEDR